MTVNSITNTDHTGGLASSYVPRRRTLLDEPLGIGTQSVEPEVVYVPGTPEIEKVKDKTVAPDASGMSRGMANGLAGAQIGLGLLGYLENRKTGKLQREALRHDIATAKEQRANRAALGASWNKAWSGNGG